MKEPSTRPCPHALLRGPTASFGVPRRRGPGIGRTVFPDAASGSLVRDAQGNVIGSSLLGQSFSKPEHFPPAALGGRWRLRRRQLQRHEPGPDQRQARERARRRLLLRVSPDSPPSTAWRTASAADAVIPADAATRSASGLDPDISPANAQLQVTRVAKARNLDAARVESLVRDVTTPRTLGLFGEPRVNVLRLNLPLIL